MEKKLNLNVNGDSQAGLKGFKLKKYVKRTESLFQNTTSLILN